MTVIEINIKNETDKARMVALDNLKGINRIKNHINKRRDIRNITPHHYEGPKFGPSSEGSQTEMIKNYSMELQQTNYGEGAWLELLDNPKFRGEYLEYINLQSNGDPPVS